MRRRLLCRDTVFQTAPGDPDTCEVCHRCYPGELMPFGFAKCNFCEVRPSFHHGRCCPKHPEIAENLQSGAPPRERGRSGMRTPPRGSGPRTPPRSGVPSSKSEVASQERGAQDAGVAEGSAVSTAALASMSSGGAALEAQGEHLTGAHLPGRARFGGAPTAGPPVDRVGLWDTPDAQWGDRLRGFGLSSHGAPAASGSARAMEGPRAAAHTSRTPWMKRRRLVSRPATRPTAGGSGELSPRQVIGALDVDVERRLRKLRKAPANVDPNDIWKQSTQRTANRRTAKRGSASRRTADQRTAGEAAPLDTKSAPGKSGQ